MKNFTVKDRLVVESAHPPSEHHISSSSSSGDSVSTLNVMFLMMPCKSNKLFESVLRIAVYPGTRGSSGTNLRKLSRYDVKMTSKWPKMTENDVK